MFTGDATSRHFLKLPANPHGARGNGFECTPCRILICCIVHPFVCLFSPCVSPRPSPPKSLAADDFNLYDDLDSLTGKRAAPAVPVDSEDLRTARARVAQLEAEGAAKDKKLEKVVKLNAVLVKNVSILFKTAQAEIARKDAEIARLRESYAGLSMAIM